MRGMVGINPRAEFITDRICCIKKTCNGHLRIIGFGNNPLGGINYKMDFIRSKRGFV